MNSWHSQVPANGWSETVLLRRPLRRREIEGFAVLMAWKFERETDESLTEVTPAAFKEMMSDRIVLYGPLQFIEDAFLENLSMPVFHDLDASSSETLNAAAPTGGNLYSVVVCLDDIAIAAYHSVIPSSGLVSAVV